MDMPISNTYRSQFAALKCSRIRWLPSTKQPHFLTATYDSRFKQIAAWSITQHVEEGEGEGGEDDIFKCECKLKVASDVNDLIIYDGMKFATAMNDGTVRLLEYDDGVIKPMKKYGDMHNGCSCNALCYDNGRIISGGQGGTLVSVDLQSSSKEVISLGMASVRALASISQNIFVSAHLDGQICLWDLREEMESSSKPAFSCRVTDCFQGVTSLAVHPAEPNLVGFGTEDGGIGFIDTRRSSYLLNAVAVPFPVGTVWEVAFHPVYPSNFYCATGKGHLLHLSVKGAALSNSISSINGQSRANAWLSPLVRSGNANVTALIDGLISVSTFSVSTNGIIACSDNQMITYVDKNYLA